MRDWDREFTFVILLMSDDAVITSDRRRGG